MRLLFIPGFGEEVSIFEKIESFIPGKKVFIENWTLLEEIPENGLDVSVYAEFLVNRFKIKKEDVVIGHSMGGWIALFIKNLTGCRTIQIAAWTNSKKLIKVPLERHLMFWLAKKGFGFNRLILSILVCLNYKNKPSKKIFITVFERLRRGNKQTVAKQLMIIYNRLHIPVKISPDLRIHARGDQIVKYPDEYFYEVPGDHFSLYTHPETVYKPIVQFLSRLE